MTTFQSILFDLDGTLIDSIELILASYRHTLEQHGRPQVPDAVWLEGVGTPLRVQLGRFAESAEDLVALVATYREYNLSNHDRMIRPFPGIAELVRDIRARGYSLGVVTSKNREGTLRGLRLAGIADYFDVLVCADDVQNPKPHPEPVAMAVRALRASPSATLFLGDSIHDLHSGRGASVQTGAVLWGPFSRPELEPAAPDFWFEQPDELRKLLLGQ
jgi:pyrophosphatase PpaX